MSDIEAALPVSDRIEEEVLDADPYDAKVRAERARRNETVENMIERMRLHD